MIVVTGTKRSGTSMWMQILAASGIEVFGDAFPRDWKDSIGDANPHGFFESPLRWGITPHGLRKAELDEPPSSGALKIFVPGLIRTDEVHLDYVIATVRHWREYVASIHRLRQMQHESKPTRRRRPEPDPVWEWWLENFALIRDVVQRGYPVRFVTYEDVLAAPDDLVPPILDWIGSSDATAGTAVVSDDARTQQRTELRLEHPLAHRFDELYDAFRTSRELDRGLLVALNDTHSSMCEVHREEPLPHRIPLDPIRG